MASLRNKKLIVQAGAQYEFPIRGNTVKVVDASCVVYFKTQDGQVDFYLEKGERASFEGVNFLNLVIYHLESTDQKISISVGDGAEITSARVAGEVSVIDGSVLRVKKGNTFINGFFNDAAVGLYSHVQLWNPAASGVNLIVDTLIISSIVSQTAWVKTANAAILNLNSNGSNKLLGGVATKGELRGETNAIALGNGTISSFSINVGFSNFEIKDNFILPPGNGLILVPRIANSGIGASFQYYEESL